MKILKYCFCCCCKIPKIFKKYDNDKQMLVLMNRQLEYMNGLHINEGFILELIDGRFGFTKILPPKKCIDNLIKNIKIGEWSDSCVGKFVPYFLNGKINLKLECDAIVNYDNVPVKRVRFCFNKNKVTKCVLCFQTVPLCCCSSVFFPYYNY